MAEKDKKEAARVWGVDDLAKDLDIQPASVRVALRKKDIERPGRAYEWTSKKAYDEVLKQLKDTSDDAKPAAKPATKSKAAPAKTTEKKSKAA